MIDSTDSTEVTSPGPLPGGPGPRPRLAGLRARGATAAVALGLVAGGVAGGFMVSQAATSSSSSSTATGTSGAGGSTGTTPATPGAASSGGTLHPNEDPAHEAGESAQREAQENAGQVPTVP